MSSMIRLPRLVHPDETYALYEVKCKACGFLISSFVHLNALPFGNSQSWLRCDQKVVCGNGVHLIGKIPEGENDNGIEVVIRKLSLQEKDEYLSRK
jgi:hypothetical protein